MDDTHHKEISFTPDETMEEFASGREIMCMYYMKCIGYDNAFQRDLSTMPPNWKPQNSSTKKGKANDGTDEKDQKTKKRKRAAKSESESEEEEIGGQFEDSEADYD